MQIIEIATLENGAHRNQTASNISIIPNGWAILPSNIEVENFPFGEITVDEINGIMTVTSWTPVDKPNPDINFIKTIKKQELSSACNSAIIIGMDVETTKGTEHFSLEETDQINLTTAVNAIQQGATEYPYHADGSLCRMFTADEINSIAQASIAHKLYHTTLCNHLLTWVRRAETIEEIEGITYSSENLPSDLAANMVTILSQASNL